MPRLFVHSRSATGHEDVIGAGGGGEGAGSAKANAAAANKMAVPAKQNAIIRNEDGILRFINRPHPY